MTKKLEINFTKKPEIVFQFDQFLNVEQAVDKFLNKKENLNKLIAPLIPTNLEETIQKLIPEVSDGYTPQKGVDYDDGKDGETPSDEKIISLIKPQIPKVIPGKDGTTPKKGIDYFTKKELDEIKKELKTTILSEMPEHATKEEVNIKITEVLDKIRKLPTGGGGAQFLRQLMDVNVGNPTAQQYGLTYNPSRSEFALTPITGGGGGAVDSVNGQTGVVVLDQDDIGDGTTYKQYSATEKTKLAGIESGAEVNTIDTVSDTTEIDLAITARDLTATIRAGSIDESKLDASVNTSLGKADTAVQPAGLAGYELLSNKSTDTALGTSNTLYPTQNAVKTYVDNSVVGLLDDRGNYDASVNTFPASGGSGTAGAILKGDFWFISVAGTLGGVPVAIGDSLRSLTDTPGQTASNWSVLEGNIGYVPENVANKENTTIDTNTTKYPTVNLLKTGLDTKQATLVSGTNIKTVNSTTLLGSGDLAVATTAQGALADTALQPANISDTAYDATSWNGVTTIAPSKNAVRDKIETMDSAIALNTAKVTNATHTGDATGDTALTVVKINGTSLAGLATGILKNTTTTGVPSIAVNSDLPTMTATVGGAVPTPPNNTTTFLRGDGTFAAPASAGFDPTTTQTFFDDFMMGNETTGSIGEQGWSSQNIAGTSTFNVSSQGSRTGNFRITSGATDNNGGVISAGGGLLGGANQFPMAVGNRTIIFSVKPANVSDVCIRCGLASDGQSSPISTGIYFELDTDVNANWRGVCNGASTSYTASSTAPTTSYKQFKIVFNSDATSIEFFVDGSSIGALTTNITGDNGEPFFQVITRTSGAKSGDIDYFYMTTTGLSR